MELWAIGDTPASAGNIANIVTVIRILLAPGFIWLLLWDNGHDGYLRYIANRRATQIGLEELFPNEENPFPWMSEMIDLKKERNFFETRVIEYQSGGALSWD